MMQAVVKAKAEPGLWLQEVPVPEFAGDDPSSPEDGDILAGG